MGPRVAQRDPVLSYNSTLDWAAFEEIQAKINIPEHSVHWASSIYSRLRLESKRGQRGPKAGQRVPKGAKGGPKGPRVIL